MNFFWTSKAPAKPECCDPTHGKYFRAMVEHTEANPAGGVARLDKSMGGGWSVELDDGQFVTLDSLAACWLANNPKGGKNAYYVRIRP